MTVIVSDSFNRTNNTTSLGTTDSASGGTAKAWTGYSGTWGISSNQARAYASSDAIAYVDAGISNCIITVKLANTLQGRGIVFRQTGTADSCFQIQLEGVIRIYQRPSWTVVAESTAAFGTSTVAAGAIMKVELQGTSIKVYINDVLAISTTSTFNQTATRHGFGAWGSDVLYDDFVIEDFVTGTTGTTYTGSGTAQGNSNLIGTEKMILKATGTLQSSANLSSVEKSILKALGTATGYANVSSGETLTQQQGTTYTGGGTAQGSANVSSNENYRYKANGTLQGIASLSSGETLILFTGNVYSASGTIQSYSTLNSQEKMTYKAIGTALGYSSLEVHEIVSMMASGIAQGYADVMLVEPKQEIVARITLHGSQNFTITLKGKSTNSLQLNGNTNSSIHLKGGIQ